MADDELVVAGATTPSAAPAVVTGDHRVDAALHRLTGLDDLPLAAQVTVFDDVHRLLQDALTSQHPSAGSVENAGVSATDAGRSGP